ncbi:MAG: AI-2E family transporter [Ruminococcus sp.]|nr:AI-2E family transporter [Ruminococcus sp.]
MKKLTSIKTILIAISFTVFLLFIKDNTVVVWKVLSTIMGILIPFIIGFFIAYILNFPYKFFYTKAFGKMGTKRKFLKKVKKPLSLVCTYTLVVAVIAVLIAIVVPQITVNIASLVESFPTYFDSLVENIYGFIDSINKTFNANIDSKSIIDSFTAEIMKYFSMENITKFAGNATQAIGNIFTVVSNTANGVYNIVMGVVISVYFLSAKESLCNQVKRLAVAFIPIKYLPKIYEIVDITDTKCGRFLVGDILDAGFVGLLTFITMSILQIPYAPLIAVLVGVTNIIPFFGPFIGAVPSALILFIISPWEMIKFIIVVVVIQQLDGNLFKPKIIGSQVGLSSFWVLFSVIVGGALFGLPGFILGTPIYAVIYSLVGKRVRNSINDKGKIAQEALDFEVLNYQKIAAEQKKIREEKENQQKEKLKKLIHLNKSEETEEADSDENE